MKELKEAELKRCQIQEWYPRFKSTSMKIIIHELPESFIEYLLDNSGPFLLPISIFNHDAFPKRIHNPEDDQDFTISKQQQEESDDESDQTPPPPSFPELETQINQSIKTLGGAIFPKLNWSSPKDIEIMSPVKSLKCTSFIEIVLLLKSSTGSMVHDLCNAYESCSDCNIHRPASFFLALRKWYPDLHPGREFRVFIHNHVLVGISQRDCRTFYPFLTDMKHDIQKAIQKFYIDKVSMGFESESYTFDVYVRKDMKVKLVDFNPWIEYTLSLLFTWEELESEQLISEPEFRIVESQCGVRPGLKTAVPYDFLDRSEGSGWDQFFKNAEEQLLQQTRSAGGG